MQEYTHALNTVLIKIYDNTIDIKPMFTRQAITIGISGPSCSGKSALANTLHSLLGHPQSSILRLDDFYLPDSQIPFISVSANVQDWDCIDSLNWTEFINALKARKGKVDFKVFKVTDAGTKDLNVMRDSLPHDQSWLIVDGFLLFHDQTLLPSFDLRFFVQTPKETLKTRRSQRVYPSDMGPWADPPEYFDNVVWERHLEYHSPLYHEKDGFKKNGIIVLDGTRSIVDLLKEILQEMLRYTRG